MQSKVAYFRAFISVKLKTSLLSVNSLFKEFHIFIDHNVS